MQSQGWYATQGAFCSHCNHEVQIPSGSSLCPQCHRYVYRAAHRSSHRQIPPDPPIRRTMVPRPPLRERYGLEGVSAVRNREEPLFSGASPRQWPGRSAYSQVSMQPRQHAFPYSDEIRTDPLTSLMELAFGGGQIRGSQHSLQHFFTFFPSRQANVLQFLFNSLDLVDMDEMPSIPWGQPPDFSQIFTHMTHLRPDRVHPASQSSVNHLETVAISRAMEVKGELCTICQEKYSRNEQVNKLPCGHLFHKECLEPWLQTHSTCPVCRLDLQ